MPTDTLQDVVVIGAGAAGVSAAVECFDVRLDVVVLEAARRVGGQIEEIPHEVRNVVTAEDGNDAIVGALTHHASTLGDRLRLGQEVHRVDLATGVVEAGRDRFRARSVLIATGSRRRHLEVAPDGAFGGDVTYLVEPHVERFAGRPVVVVGGGDSAVLDALGLADMGSAVTLVHRSPRLTARHDLVERLRTSGSIVEVAGWTVDALVGSDRLQAVELASPSTGEHRRVEAGGLVLKLGRQKRVELVRGQLDLGPDGGIVTDAGMQTSSPRTFAAGDVTAGAYERVATAVGQGSLAVRSILTHLESDR